MNSTQIQCFLTVAECGSFSRAAQKLYMSQPTLGRQIAALEQELGFLLFLRDSHTTVLTEEGQMMREGLSDLSAQYDTLLQQVRNLHRSGGSLSLGLLRGQMLDGRTGVIVRAFRTRFPDAGLTVAHYNYRGMADALLQGDLDLGVTLSPDAAARPGLTMQELGCLENHLVISRSHPLAEKEHLSLRDFSADTFIEISPEDSPTVSALMTHSCMAAGFTPNIRYVPDLTTQIFWLESGFGIAAFNMYHEAWHHPGLVHIPLPELPPVPFCLAWCSGNSNPALKHFLELTDALLP